LIFAGHLKSCFSAFVIGWHFTPRDRPKSLRNRVIHALGRSARKGGKTLASTVKISMLQPETALSAPWT